jgi:hypothetical protein
MQRRTLCPWGAAGLGCLASAKRLARYCAAIATGSGLAASLFLTKSMWPRRS